ncbi:MAG: carbohydrate ABC transporter permease [Oscillospiraceae bacterium]|nr:carbohydrate ABC transporter permease [Oscillospiraceae bacterium]
MIRDTSLSSKLLDVLVHTVMAVVLVATLYPVLFVLAASFSSKIAVDAGQVTVYPIGFHIDNYNLVFSESRIMRAFSNSVRYTAIGTLSNLAVTSMMAYALSRRQLAFRKLYNWIIIIPLYFSGGLIPTFILMVSLGFYGSMWALILPNLVGITNLIIMRTFFQSLPIELEESASLDGANDLLIFFRIILPLSKPVIFTILLYYLVFYWNSWFSAFIYLPDAKMAPLQLVIRELIVMGQSILQAVESGTTSDLGEINLNGIRYATLFVSMIPMLVIYPFIQKYFVQGVMIGSLKG